MHLNEAAATWPPGRPDIPSPWAPQPQTPAPQPILPSWFEPTSVNLERELADRLLQQRVILAGGRLDERLAGHITAQLLLLDAESNDVVTVHLSATDADLDAALALAGAIGLITAPVHVVARGTVRGPAVAVLAAAAVREAHRHTTFVLSVPDVTAEGTADELAAQADQHQHEFARLRDLIATATGRRADEIARDLERGRVLTAEEARDYGLISRLL